MTIYMDRHDVSEAVTAADLAQLHQRDLKIQDRFGCRGLTYWFDEKRKTAFCLIEAPDENAIREMHKYAHGQVPHRLIEVDPFVVEAFLGRVGDPIKMQDHGLHIIRDPAFRIIMAVDLKLLSLDREETERFNASLNRFTMALPNKLKELDNALVKQSYGRYLFSFTSVSNAVHAALRIRNLFVDFRKTIHPENLHLKIGLSTGDPVTEKSQIFEKAVKLAERMARIIPAELAVSSEVKELYNSENPEPLAERDGLCFLTAEDEDWITCFMDYAEAHWQDVDLKVDDFNQPTGSSKSGLYRKLVSLTGKPPITFIKDYRLDEALILLQKKMVNVSEAAYETGFSSPSYFTRCFQKRFGHSPSGRLNSAFKQELLLVS